MDDPRISNSPAPVCAASPDLPGARHVSRLDSAVTLSSTPPPTMPEGYTGGKRMPQGMMQADLHHVLDSGDSSESESDSDDGGASSTSSEVDYVKTSRPPSAKKPRKSQPPHLRRLRVSTPDEGTAAIMLRRRKEASMADDPSSAADLRALELHPVLAYVRDHTPVRPCMRCADCRGEPCGRCGNCRNNEALPPRSRDRRRCTTLPCKKLRDIEFKRYRDKAETDERIADIKQRLGELHTAQLKTQRGTTGAQTTDSPTLKKRRDELASELRTLTEKEEARRSDESAPEGYDCYLTTLSTLETERDRLARLVARSGSRVKHADLMHMRQTRNQMGLYVCQVARARAADMVPSGRMAGLIEVINEYEAFIYSSSIE